MVCIRAITLLQPLIWTHPVINSTYLEISLFGNQLAIIVREMLKSLMRPFLMMENWKSPVLTTRIDADMSGNSIDDIAGTLVIDKYLNSRQ